MWFVKALKVHTEISLVNFTDTLASGIMRQTPKHNSAATVKIPSIQLTEISLVTRDHSLVTQP